MRTIITLLALGLTGVCQLLMLAHPAPADWFFMATGAGIFALAVSLHLSSQKARGPLLINAFVMMFVVGMRFDATPSLIFAAVVFVGSLLAAALVNKRNGQQA